MVSGTQAFLRRVSRQVDLDCPSNITDRSVAQMHMCKDTEEQ